MANKKVKTRIQNKHDLECNWIKATGFCPMEGELIIYDIEVDSSGNVLTGALINTGRTEPYKHVRYKIGDGIHYVNDLPFVSEGAAKGTTSTGRYSHAEGAETIAQGNQAHAEGNKTEATGPQAHAEGYETKATAVAAHAEGLGTLAANDGAHAQGKFTKAIGDASAANGYWTEANHAHQFVIGRVNANDENNLFEVGGGAVYYDSATDTFTEDEFDRFNVFEVSSEGYTGAERIATKDTIFNRKEGTVKDGVEYARWHNGPTGKVDPIIIPGAVASGFQSVAFGGQRIDKTLKAYKKDPETPAEEPQTQALGDQSFAAGGSVIVNGDWSAGFGKETTTYQKAAFATGGGTRAGCTEEEYTNYAAVQRDDTSAYAASYSLSMAEGELTKALGRTSHAEGRYGLTTGMASHVEGNESVAVGKYSHAEGWQTKTGTFTGNNKTGEIVIETSGTAAHTEGRGTTANADYAHAEGTNTLASNIASHAEGNGSIASGQYSHAEGSSKASSECAHAEGKGTTASGIASHTEGEGTIATHANAHAEGYSTDAINENAHAEGNNSEASGIASHAEGSLTKAKGSQAHAEGASTVAVGNNSHTEGYRTLAKGVAAHAEGYSVTDLTNKYDANSSDGTIKTDWEANKNFGAAVGQGSHAEGLNNLAYGRYSHVGGSCSEAVGNNSFAHGDHATASVANQAVFGSYNSANANALFIVGNGTSDSDRKNAFTVKKDGTAECANLEVENIFRNGNSFYNVLEIASTKYVDEIVIKTKIPYLNSNSMPLIHIKGYAYGTQSPVDFNIAFYIWEDAITSSGVTFVGHGWKPEIYLSSYTENDTKYIALSLTGIIYYPRLTVDFTDIWGITTKRNYSTGWSYQTREQDKTGEAETLVPQTDLKVVPYKTLATNISGNATSADYVNKAITVKLNSGTTEGTNQFTFNGSAAKTINITPAAIGAALATHEHTKNQITDFDHNHDDRYYTDTEVDDKIRTAISSVLKYKGTKSTTTQLPTSGNATGDVWNITTACAASGTLPKVNAGDNVAWNGSAWDVLAGTVDLSSYYTESEVDSLLAGKSDNHNHPYLPDSTKYAGSATQGGAANSVANSLSIQLNSGTATTFNGSATKSINITPAAIGASASGHDHDDRYYTETETDNLITAAKGYADSQDDAKAVFVKGIGENSVQKKFGASIADDDNILTTISSNLISTTPLALGESALSLGSSYSIICGGLGGPSLNISSVDGNSLTCTINLTAKELLEKLLEKFSISVTGKKIGFYLKIDNAYYLVYSEQITTTGNFITGYKINLTADETISEETLDSLVNKSASQIIACVAGGIESFTVNSGSATGKRAFAANIMTQASGEGACAFGGTSISGGLYSAAFGSSVVYGGKALGGGNSTILANAQGSIGVGEQVTTDGPQSAIFGFKNTIGANANQATVIGALNNSDYKRTFIGGHGNTAKADDQVILGAFAEASANDYFVLGCGSGTDNPKNAFKVTSDGTYGIGTYFESGAEKVGCTKLATESWVKNVAVSTIGSSDSYTKGAVMLYHSINDGSDGFQIAAASSSHAVSLGHGTRAEATMSFAANNQTNATFASSAAFGYKTTTTNGSQLVCGVGAGGSTGEGSETDSSITKAYFRVACGSKDGLAVLANGNVNIGGCVYANNSIEVKGNLKQTGGHISTGGNITANYDVIAKRGMQVGEKHTLNTSTGQNAVFGWQNTLGADCKQTVIMGAGNTSNHPKTFVCGQGNTTAKEYQAIFGTYANVNADMYLAVGNGESASKPSNAFYITNTGTYGMGQDATGATSCTKLATEAWVRNTVLGGKTIQVVDELPTTQEDGVIYFVYE